MSNFNFIYLFIYIFHFPKRCYFNGLDYGDWMPRAL